MKLPAVLTHAFSSNIKIAGYQMGLLQAKGYRMVKNQLHEALSELNLAPIEWTALGLLSSKKEGMRFAEVAAELGVEAPFVTVLIEKLKKKNMVEYGMDNGDKRAKRIFITGAGKALMPEAEKSVKREMKKLMTNSTAAEIAAYFKVLSGIVDSSSL